METDRNVVVRVWRKDEDLTPLRRFWYDIYVTEMGRHTDTANHEFGELDDDRAGIGEIIVAQEGNRVVGTLICTPSWTGALGEYEALYNMKGLGDIHPGSTGIITKMMVAPEYRHTMLSLRICRLLYRHGVPMGVHHPFMDCNHYLVPLFEKIGFKPWGRPVNHHDYGQVHVMHMNCLDLEHLEAVDSPVLSVAREFAPHILNIVQHQLKEGVHT